VSQQVALGQGGPHDGLRLFKGRLVKPLLPPTRLDAGARQQADRNHPERPEVDWSGLRNGEWPREGCVEETVTLHGAVSGSQAPGEVKGAMPFDHCYYTIIIDMVMFGQEFFHPFLEVASRE
jgi:hypothetical protein